MLEAGHERKRDGLPGVVESFWTKLDGIDQGIRVWLEPPRLIGTRRAGERRTRGGRGGDLRAARRITQIVQARSTNSRNGYASITTGAGVLRLGTCPS
jgi:hypothetical protein